MDTFNKLMEVIVNEHTEKKGNLTYLSWAFAWAECKKNCPDANYEIWKDPSTHLPYVYDPATGYMVFTSVTIDGETHEMWLFVMDGANKAMKAEPYTYETRNGEKKVAAATMFDINTTIMRCLVKNIGMFGLGLYIYAGDDIPNKLENKKAVEKETAATLLKKFKAAALPKFLKYDAECLALAFEEVGAVSTKEEKEPMLVDLLAQVSSKEKLVNIGKRAKELQTEVDKSSGTPSEDIEL